MKKLKRVLEYLSMHLFGFLMVFGAIYIVGFGIFDYTPKILNVLIGYTIGVVIVEIIKKFRKR